MKRFHDSCQLMFDDLRLTVSPCLRCALPLFGTCAVSWCYPAEAALQTRYESLRDVAATIKAAACAAYVRSGMAII